MLESSLYCKVRGCWLWRHQLKNRGLGDRVKSSGSADCSQRPRRRKQIAGDIRQNLTHRRKGVLACSYSPAMDNTNWTAVVRGMSNKGLIYLLFPRQYAATCHSRDLEYCPFLCEVAWTCSCRVEGPFPKYLTSNLWTGNLLNMRKLTAWHECHPHPVSN